eukprot:364460-Chlamydomonas_euryale.AAC.3
MHKLWDQYVHRCCLLLQNPPVMLIRAHAVLQRVRAIRRVQHAAQRDHFLSARVPACVAVRQVVLRGGKSPRLGDVPQPLGRKEGKIAVSTALQRTAAKGGADAAHKLALVKARGRHARQRGLLRPCEADRVASGPRAGLGGWLWHRARGKERGAQRERHPFI